MARLKDYYKQDIAPALMKKFSYKSVMQIPKLEKVVINVGAGEAKDNAKAIEADAQASKKEAETALSALIKAQNNLEEVTEAPDKTALTEMIQEAETKQQEAYTEESWNAFKTALDAAKEVEKAENATKEQIEEAQKYCKIEAFQPQYSLADRKDEKLIRWAYEQGLGIMTYGTLGGGILTGNYRKLRTFEQTDSRNRFYPYFKEPLFSKAMELLTIMDQIAEERNVSLAQIAEKWVIQKRFVSSCIIGTQSRARVEENCRNLQWELTDNEIRRLESVRIL